MLKRLYILAPVAAAAATALAVSATAHADTTDPLLDSTHAIFMGGTAQPTPSTAYVEAADSLYLKPLGFSDELTSICNMVGNLPCDGSLQVLTTPEVFEFGPSSLQGETNLVYAVEADYKAGDFSAENPLTVFAYSQSAIVASAAEQRLYDDGIPLTDLHFVFIGDPSSVNGIATNIYADTVQLFGGGTTGTTIANDIFNGINEAQFAPGGLLAGYTPTDLYPTTSYNIDYDGVSDWQEDYNIGLNAPGGSPLLGFANGLFHFFTTHVEYLGLTPDQVATGVPTVDDMLTTINIPDGSDAGTMINDFTALVDAFGHGLADSGSLLALANTVIDLFDPNYF